MPGVDWHWLSMELPYLSFLKDHDLWNQLLDLRGSHAFWVEMMLLSYKKNYSLNHHWAEMISHTSCPCPSSREESLRPIQSVKSPKQKGMQGTPRTINIYASWPEPQKLPIFFLDVWMSCILKTSFELTNVISSTSRVGHQRSFMKCIKRKPSHFACPSTAPENRERHFLKDRELVT